MLMQHVRMMKLQKNLFYQYIKMLKSIKISIKNFMEQEIMP